MDKFPQRQGGVKIWRGFCFVVFRKVIPRGKTFTFWQNINDLAKPILRGKSHSLAYFKPANADWKNDSCYGHFTLNIVN